MTVAPPATTGTTLRWWSDATQSRPGSLGRARPPRSSDVGQFYIGLSLLAGGHPHKVSVAAVPILQGVVDRACDLRTFAADEPRDRLHHRDRSEHREDCRDA